MGFLKNISTAVMICFAACVAVAGDFSISELNLNHPDGIYKKGEEIIVTGTLLKAEKPAPE